MDVLVIGGNGFIGSHVVDECLAQGDRVRVLDRRPEAFRDPLPSVDYAVGDLGDPSAVFEALAGVDTVIHLASTTVPATSNLDPVGDITGNLVATVRLLATMRTAGVRRIVFLSSGGTVYGIPRAQPGAGGAPAPSPSAPTASSRSPSRTTWRWRATCTASPT
jgi:UDP-glucose 4-epimerase